jgi:hypothetical protein
MNTTLTVGAWVLGILGAALLGAGTGFKLGRLFEQELAEIEAEDLLDSARQLFGHLRSVQ